MKKIFVTQPDLPPLEEFTELLKKIWDNRMLTNMGEFHKKFEHELCNFLGVKHLSLFNNGTTALMAALRQLNIQGEVITTPYSFAATAHVLAWNNIKPVFIDVEPGTFNLDPEKIESAISDKTEAILPVHVYGNPCDVEKIKKIADKHNLKIIYDACHAFGVELNKIPIVNYGDLSVLSFHATKVFNTFEGGAIISNSEKTKNQIDRLKNFGFVNQTTVKGIGINGKMNEFQAALGLLQIKQYNENLLKRKEIVSVYRNHLIDINGIKFLNDIAGVKHNYSYFPILVDEKKYGKTRDELFQNLKQHGINARRYFYPLISKFPAYKNLTKHARLATAEKISKQVICLPLFSNLNLNDMETILNVIRN